MEYKIILILIVIFLGTLGPIQTGVNSTLSNFKEEKVGDSLKKLENEDLLKFGMIPEFIGRLPVCATLQELDQEMLVKIMIEPKNAILKQFELLFKMDNIILEIKDDALKEIAKMAIKRKTGARGLRSIMENLLSDLMFKSPDLKELKKIIINFDVVTNKSSPIMLFSNKTNADKDKLANQKLRVNKS